MSDPQARRTALEGVAAFLDAGGWRVRGAADSPIEGGDGNREFLLWAQRRR